MRELGSFSQKAHQEIGRLAGDCSYMAEEFSLSGKPAYFFQDLKELKKALYCQLEKGDVVLVKAFKSLKMWEVLD